MISRQRRTERKGTPPKSPGPHDSPQCALSRSNSIKLDYYTNNQILRSFNSLILADEGEPMETPPRAFKPKKLFSFSRDVDAYDDLHDASMTETDFDDGTSPHDHPSMRRSNKFLDLSLDKENVMDESTPHRSQEASAPSFKRPHGLVSQSPSPSHPVYARSPSLSLSRAQKLSRNLNHRLLQDSPAPSPTRQTVLSPTQRGNLSPKHRGTLSPKHRGTLSPKQRGTLSPIQKGALSPIQKGALSPRSPFFSKMCKMRKVATPSALTSTPLYQAASPFAQGTPFTHGTDQLTPSYKFARPLHLAFVSAGLQKKSLALPTATLKPSEKVMPETPCKPIAVVRDEPSRLQHCISQFTEEFTGDHGSIFGGRGTPSKPMLMWPVAMPLGGYPEVLPVPATAEKSALVVSGAGVKKSASAPAACRLHGRAGRAEAPAALNLALGDETADSFSHHTANFSFAPHDQTGNTTADGSFGGKGEEFGAVLPMGYGPAPRTPVLRAHVNSSTDSFERERAAFLTEFGRPAEVEDRHLVDKFGARNVRLVGAGEFLQVFELSFQGARYAVKRTKRRLTGRGARARVLQEMAILRALTGVTDPSVEEDEGKEYVIRYIESWHNDHHFYLMTEYCENGTLADFLQENTALKLDEFRVWKILIEVLTGLNYIHQNHFLHLDIKPSNIFVTFEGSLKIGDFGMSLPYPVPAGLDLEGDRNYIAPELLIDSGPGRLVDPKYTPLADIFSLGLVVVEAAANIVLPENGTPWRKLRSGDLSDAGKLSSDNIHQYLSHQRLVSDPGLSMSSAPDSSRYTATTSHSVEGFKDSATTSHLGWWSRDAAPPCTATDLSSVSTTPSSLFIIDEAGVEALPAVPLWAPLFLIDNSMKLDLLVRSMVSPAPENRPSAKAILATPECVLVENRRKSGALIYEGEFGPDPLENSK